MNLLYAWVFIALVVLSGSAGDVLLAKGMTSIGDLDEIKAKRGFLGAVRSVVTSYWFMGGVACMAISFFSLLIALSWGDLSMVAPASASLTFVSSAIAARFILKENVDKRRWVAIVLVCAGVAMLNG
jgi:drug/metabolite transporter (DMT)-like permease